MKVGLTSPLFLPLPYLPTIPPYRCLSGTVSHSSRRRASGAPGTSGPSYYTPFIPPPFIHLRCYMYTYVHPLYMYIQPYTHLTRL